ncbi:hypothetical protein E2C01_073752 [Portunus trituberculatus]|uniref:Uncharacterized protein n=1 Tax=Portunus trituberculatus TaxID=210409 RepID=A0A5B7IBF1_PORTR|nr:hypothetical protein [Portunus trituberculatus]
MTAIAHKTNHERREQGLSDKHYHTLSSDQFEYLEDLAREAGLKQPPLFMPQLLRIVLLRCKTGYIGSSQNLKLHM